MYRAIARPAGAATPAARLDDHEVSGGNRPAVVQLVERCLHAHLHAHDDQPVVERRPPAPDPYGHVGAVSPGLRRAALLARETECVRCTAVIRRHRHAALNAGLRLEVRVQLEARGGARSEEHTSELQSRLHLVCRLLLEKKKNSYTQNILSK